MDSNPVHHLSPAKKTKCSFLDYFQLLMISWAGQLTQIPSTTSLQPKKWNAHFYITFNIWLLAGLINGLECHLPPLSSLNNEMPIFVLCWTSNDQPGWSMASNPIHHLSLAKIMKCSFLDYVQLLMISWAGQWTQILYTTSLQPKNEMLIFGLDSTSEDQLGRLMDSNLICHTSPAKKWNAHFWIMFNFWWLAWLVDGFEPHLPPLSSQKNEMLIFGLCLTSDNEPGWSMDSAPISHPSPAKKWNACFCITFNFW